MESQFCTQLSRAKEHERAWDYAMDQKESEHKKQTWRYLDRVKALEARYPFYSVLDNFRALPVGTSRTILTVLEFCVSKEIEGSCEYRVRDYELNNTKSLGEYLERDASDTDGCSGRLFILEDPSTDFINLLGQKFNVDPTVFAAYSYFSNQTTPKNRKVTTGLPSRHFESTAYALKYYEIRDFPSKSPDSHSVRTAVPGNVPREVSLSRQPKAEKKSEDVVTGSIQRSMGFWFSTEHERSPWTALILVDPEVNDEICTTDWKSFDKNWTIHKFVTTPYIGGPPEISLWNNSISKPDIDIQNQHFLHDITTNNKSTSCLRQCIAHHWMHSATQHELSLAAHNPRHAFLFGNFYVASNWMVVLEYLNGVISQLETTLWTFEEMPKRPSQKELRSLIDHVRRIMIEVNRWRRRTWWYLEDMNRNLEMIEHQAGSLSSDANLAMADFKYIYTRLEAFGKRVESLLPVLLGLSSLLEAQRSTSESQWVSWLTVIATVFLPISATTGIFSMSGNFAAGENEFYVPWTVIIGLILAISGLVLFVRKQRL